MSTDTTPDFDVCTSDLMRPTLLEASAGTGKTFSIKHLVLRLVAEKAIEIEKVLVVTFTKAATAELKGRIRDHLSEALGFLEGELQPDEVDGILPAQCRLWASMKDECEKGSVLDAAPARLRRALSTFDNAAVFTIHSFCQKALGAHAFTSAGNFDFEVTESDDEMLDDVVEDFLRRELDRHADEPQLRRAIMEAKDWTEKLKVLMKLPEDLAEREILTNEKSEFAGELDETMRRFVKEAPPEVARRRREARVATFDDLIVNLQQALKREEDAGERSLKDALRESYRAALIDEFQDTDPLQFDIFDRLFLREADEGDAGKRAIFLVGDPKQAIYRFRNADLNTYLDARDRIRLMKTGVVAKLGKNYRSTPKLVAALNAFYRVASETLGPFLDADLRYDAVKAHEKNSGLFRKNAEGDWVQAPPMEVWTHLGAGTSLNADQQRELCAELCAQDAVGILEASAAGEAGVAAEENAPESDIVGEVEWAGERIRLRRVRPCDFAVLVATHQAVEPYREAFSKRGMRMRYRSRDSVFATAEAREVVRLLRAFAQPGDERAMRAARTTRLVGDSFARLAKDDEAHRIRLREFFDEGLVKWRRSGVAAAFSGLMEACRTVERLLPIAGGERILTNYDHLIEILHAEGRRHRTPAGLLAWFEQKASGDAKDETQRLESDENLVAIETIHSSKGLEYPIVYLPGCWWGSPVKNTAVPLVHERDEAGERRLVLFPGEVKPKDLPDFKRAQIEESVRLLYVAFTRASARLTLYGLPKWNGGGKELYAHSCSAFFHALAARENLAGWCRDEYLAVWDEFQKGMLGRAADFADVWSKTAARFAGEHPGMTVDPETLKPQTDETGPYWSIAPWAPREDGVPVMLESPEAQALPEPESVRRVDPSWVQTSYTALKKGLFGAHADAHRDDRATLSGEDETEDDESLELRRRIEDGSPMARWRSGAALGVTIHRLFEVVDFHGFECRRVLATDEELADPGLSDEIRRNRLRQRNYLLSILGATPDLVRRGEGLPAETPGEDRLSPEGAKRLEELRTLFDSVLSLPILPDFRLKDLKAECRRSEYGFLLHTKPNLSKTAFAKKAAELGWKGLTEEQLSGYLTGSIDLLFEANGKIWILDWKTDNLAANAALREAFPEAKDWRDFYAEDAVALHMKEAHYDIQYLCYLAAAKRLLRARLGEGAEERLGGSLYFFVRGASAGRGVAVLPYEDVAERVKILEEMLGD